MKHLSNHRMRSRRGLTMIEVLVSGTLLTSALALSTPLLVRHTHLLSQSRQYRLAIDEVCNQADRLSALSEPEIRRELPTLALSDFAAKHLPGAKLTGEIDADELGHRLTLQLRLPEVRMAAPIRMSVWIMPPTAGGAP